MNDNKKAIWYVRPLDSYTNKVIVDGAYPDATIECSVTIEGEAKQVKMLEVSYANMRMIESSRLDQHLNFEVYLKIGNATIRPSPFKDGKLKCNVTRQVLRKVSNVPLRFYQILE